MKLFILFLLIISTSLQARSILVIGDSHMANPLGQYLLEGFKDLKSDVVVLGHASSAPKDWLGDNSSWLSGGVFHGAYINGRNYKNPNPTHYKEKVKVPKLAPLLKNMNLHSSWSKKAIKPDIVVIELGANDARAIADQNGIIFQNEYNNRLSKIKQMVKVIQNHGMQCLWITPPFGSKKSMANQKVVYQLIKEGVGDSCALYDKSNKYVASGCDGYHFNCSFIEKRKALSWSKEIIRFFNQSFK